MSKLKDVPVVILPDGRMNTKNAAMYMGISTGRLAVMRCDGNGPKFIKAGGIYYFKEDIDSWLIEGGKRIKTGSDSA